MIFSDLIDEQIFDSADEGVLGEVALRGSFGARVFRLDLAPEDAIRYQRAPGRYSTLNISPIIHTYHKARKYCTRLLCAELGRYLGSQSTGTTLVVGLGNAFLVSDSLGAEVIRRLLPTHHLPASAREDLGDMACVIPGVSGINGIPTIELVRSTVTTVQPSRVLIIDALAARNYQRLGNSFQLSDTCISPGRGVGNDNGILDRHSLGVDVVTLGVPMMINAQNFTELATLPNIVLTPKEVDIYTKTCAQVIADAINLAVHGGNYRNFI